MRLILILIFFSASFLSGCSTPYEPNPKIVTRYRASTSSANTLLSEYILSESGYFDGYFESLLMQHFDSSKSRYQNSAIFFNHLGDPFKPSQPFSIFLNGNKLLDTSQYSLTLTNYDSTNFSDPLLWQINGGKNFSTFADTLLPSQMIHIISPPANIKNIFPRQTFSVKYDVQGSDSVYIQLLILSTDTSSAFYTYDRIFHTPNTGKYNISQDIIDLLPPKAEIDVTIIAITSSLRPVNNELYLFRTGITDHIYGQLSN